MILNTALEKTFRNRDHRFMCQVVEMLIDFANFMDAHMYLKNPEPNCHSICRALAKLIPGFKVVDGNYIGLKQIRKNGKLHFKLRYTAHTWLVTPSGAIIEPYPVGFFSANPVMVVSKGTYKPYGNGYYMIDKSTTKTNVTEKTLETARELTRLMRQAIRWKAKQK